LTQTLGAPFAVAGLIEGVAESATSLLKIVSGRLADRFPSRRGLVIGGYAVSNLSKPLLALVTRWPVALGVILVDRAGKAVRGSPRDAMIADATAPEVRGKAFGFHRGADTLGAALGPLLAVGILAATASNVRAVFGWTLAPGLVALAVAVLLLRDPRARRAAMLRHAPPTPVEAADLAASAPSGILGAARSPFPLRREGGRGVRSLGPRFWLFTAAATVFALGNSSDAFLFLRTEGLESSLIAVPLLYFFFNLVYAALATPLGALSDRYGRLPVLAAGYAAFTLVYLGWTQARLPWHAWALFAVYGVYYAATEGVGKAFVTDLVPREQRGTALGWYNGLTGMAALPANVLGAWLWSQLGAGATFGLGAWLGAVACCLLVAWWPWLHTNPRPFSNKKP
jgi:MFS family permease